MIIIMCDNETIWIELVKTNYYLKSIEIEIHLCSIDMNIIFNNFNDLNNFKNMIFNKYYHCINNMDYSNNSLLLYLFVNNHVISFFESIQYPSHTNVIKIIINSNTSKNILRDEKLIKLNNLPMCLLQLKIISNIAFDLTNLPNKLFLLDISECESKLNLNYLPDSIQILYLPPTTMQNNTIFEHDKYIYSFDDLSNLPSSLVKK